MKDDSGYRWPPGWQKAEAVKKAGGGGVPQFGISDWLDDHGGEIGKKKDLAHLHVWPICQHVHVNILVHFNMPTWQNHLKGSFKWFCKAEGVKHPVS